MRQEEEQAKKNGRTNQRANHIAETEVSGLSTMDDEKDEIQLIGQQAPLPPVRFIRHLIIASGRRLPSERPVVVYVGPWRSMTADRLRHFCSNQSLELVRFDYSTDDAPANYGNDAVERMSAMRDAALAVLQQISAKSVLLVGRVSFVLPLTSNRGVVAVAATADRFASCAPSSLETVSIDAVILRVCLALNDPDSEKKIRMLERIAGSNIQIILRNKITEEAKASICALQEALRALE
uniref:Uncharacterized protein n=1 Tax=Plectus sambesii TaxID=2011161 RepID=A0A914XLS6_9BILA